MLDAEMQGNLKEEDHLGNNAQEGRGEWKRNRGNEQSGSCSKRGRPRGKLLDEKFFTMSLCRTPSTAAPAHPAKSRGARAASKNMDSLLNPVLVQRVQRAGPQLGSNAPASSCHCLRMKVCRVLQSYCQKSQIKIILCNTCHSFQSYPGIGVQFIYLGICMLDPGKIAL